MTPEVQVAAVPFAFTIMAVACQLGREAMRREMGDRFLRNLPERRTDVALLEVLDVVPRVLIVAGGVLLALAWAPR